MAAALSSGTNQQLTLDRPSFEKLLAAAWVLQCLHDQLHPPVADGKAIAQPILAQKKAEIASSEKLEIVKPKIVKPEITKPTFRISPFVMDSEPALPGACSADDGSVTELAKTQEAIETGMLELDATVKRLVSLSPKLAHESPPHEPVVGEPEPVKLLPFAVKPMFLGQPVPTPQPTVAAAPVKPSPIHQKLPDNNTPEQDASASNPGVRLNRLRGVLARHVATSRAALRLGAVNASQLAEKLRSRRLEALKGHGFSRAVLRLKGLTARLKPYPFKASNANSFSATTVNLRTTFNHLRDAVTRYKAAYQLRSKKVRGSSFDFKAALKRLQNACARTTTLRISLNLRSLRAVAIATPVWLLVLIASLLLLETWLHQPFKDARAMSAASSSTVQAAVSINPPAPAQSARPLSQLTKKIESTETRPPTPLPPFAASHDQITDAATSSVVAQLSRFEINGLRRQAKYGDDSAAFTLGMAYEVGRYVRQNCTEAARWVTVAAEAGNPAAEYNLGLRYRDGDGVSADLHESEKWLRKAAAHRNRNAKLALQLLASR
jgi:hypothetical protein